MSRPLFNAIQALLGIPLMAAGFFLWLMPIIPGAPVFFLGLALSVGWYPRGKAMISGFKDKLIVLARRCGIVRATPEEMRAALIDKALNTNDK